MTNPDSSTNPLLVIGGLLVDDIAISADSLRPASSNPVKWQHRLGGVAANVARVAVQQLNVHFIASTGDDNQGVMLCQALQTGQNTHALHAAVIPRAGKSSDRYTAVLEPDGELHIGLADAELTAQIQWQDIKSRLPTNKPGALVLDANLSQACLTETLDSLNLFYQSTVPVFALAVSPTKSLRYLPLAQQIDVLLCNRREAAALTQLDWQSDLEPLADALVQCGFHNFVITDGAHPIVVQENSKRTQITVPAVEINKNVNGSGDALAGATIANVVLGHSLVNAVRTVGMNAAHQVLTGQSEPPPI